MLGIALIGYMCSGKSTIARELAARGHFRVIDTDQAFEQKHGQTPASYIRQYGEAAFRTQEFDTLQSIVRSAQQDGHANLILATGGGLPTDPQSREYLTRHFTTVWLRVQPETVIERYGRDSADRPLLQQGVDGGDFASFVSERMAERAPLYEQAAEWTIDTDGREPREIVEWICLQYEQHRD